MFSLQKLLLLSFASTLHFIRKRDSNCATSRGPERDHLHGSSRDTHEVFDTPIGKVGLLICWDLAFPEAFRELIANGAKIMYVELTTLCISKPFTNLMP